MLRHQQCDARINLTLRGIRATIFAVKYARNITYSGCVSVDIVIQHANRMRRITLPFVTCPAVLYISTLPQKGHDLGGKSCLT